jgi:RHS repeat-associated protein
LTDLHGDVIATVNPAADTAPAATYTYTEFGAVESTSTNPGEYGYLGGAQISSAALGGNQLMGARSYSTALGRFDRTDPISGGSANNYDYTDQNPLTNEDLTGRNSVNVGCSSRTVQVFYWTYTVPYTQTCVYDLSRDETDLMWPPA